MKFLQQPIEKKLSNLLGAKVTFDRLKISPLAGRLEAEGMTVAGEQPNRPLATIRRIDARIAVAKALSGQIVVKSLVVEGPEVLLVRGENGSLRIPKISGKKPGDKENESSGWEFAAHSIHVKDGRVCYEEGSRTIRMEGINGEFACRDGEIDLGGEFTVKGKLAWKETGT